MERLSRLAHRIIWVNPRAAARDFVPKAAGMVAAMPYLDALVSGESLAALEEVVLAIGCTRAEMPGTDWPELGKRVAPTPAPEDPEDEPWGSATPEPGSSVAMPSGWTPSRGNTTAVSTQTTQKPCIFPGCERPAVPPHPLGGPQPAFCDLEDHNALTAHLERGRLVGLANAKNEGGK
jgi:hypothetical protein